MALTDRRSAIDDAIATTNSSEYSRTDILGSEKFSALQTTYFEEVCKLILSNKVIHYRHTLDYLAVVSYAR